MRNEITLNTPGLFTPENILAETPIGTQAREFVRWCFSPGDNFRNSPDLINLHFWMTKNKLKASPAEEADILAAARRLFNKNVEQNVRRAAAAPEPPQ